MSCALQCLPPFQDFLEERGFEKMKNGRPNGCLLATKKEGYQFIPLPIINAQAIQFVSGVYFFVQLFLFVAVFGEGFKHGFYRKVKASWQ